jgi:hypothetical protein
MAPTLAPPDAATAMFTFLRAAVSAMRPATATTLPSLAANLEEAVRATESSAQRALEQAELLSGHLGRLAETLARLESHVSTEPESRAAWSDAVQACLTMAPAVAAIVRALEFRDPTGQRLEGVAESVRAMRQQFDEVLALLDAPR